MNGLQKSYMIVITATIALTTLIAGLFILPSKKTHEVNAPTDPIALSEIPQVVTSDKCIQTDDDRMLVVNSPVDGLKIHNNRKYIPEKKERLKSDNNELILFVKYSDEKSVRNSLDRLGLTLVRILQSDGTVIARNPNNTSEKTINKLATKDENILYIMDSCIRMRKTTTTLSEASTPNDPYYSKLWHLNSTSGVSINKAWKTTKGSSNVLVAVVDSGIIPSHEEFSGRIYKQYDITEKDGDATDSATFSHGSHVAGIIAANADNNVGICGIASGVQLLVIDAFYYDETEGGNVADDADIFTAYDLCLEEGADIVNMSFGGLATDMDYFSRTIYESKLATLKKNNIISVAAAGNEGISDLVYPSDANSVISVIAIDQNNLKCDFSNYGVKKDISAPGKEIYSIGNATSYYKAEGTSMAAPIVSGVIALLLSRKNDLMPNEIEDIIYSTATRLGNATATSKDDNFGYGKINAAAAMDMVNEKYFSSSTSDSTSTPIPTIIPNTSITPEVVISPVNTQSAESKPSALITSTPFITESATPNHPSTPIAVTTATATATVTTEPMDAIVKKIKFKTKKITIKRGKYKYAKIKITSTPKGISLTKKASKIKWKLEQNKKVAKIVKRKKKKVRLKGRNIGKAKLFAISVATNKKAKCHIIVK